MYDVMCFGDSNTWGYSPTTGQRFPRTVRWTGVLQAELGTNYIVIEEGLNGRTTVWEDPIEGDKLGRRHLPVLLESHAPLDLVIVMLGTNDLKKRFSAHAWDIAQGAGTLVDVIGKSQAGKHAAAPAVLLISPPPLGKLSAWSGMFEGGAEKSRELGKHYAEAARQRGCPFLDAGGVIRSSDLDGIHLEEKEHQALGQAVAREVRKILR
ncbi:MAG: SGNH/GDSL hydrolase family protein [Spirochaetia bacterium]|jgi:lysophospholipase L1-like esterase